MGMMMGLITYTTGPRSVMGGSRDFDEKFCVERGYSWGAGRRILLVVLWV
jgi:hypothetical protein